jgi:hypothetical protein
MARFTAPLLSLLLAGGTLAASLHAQSDQSITVRIPFPFAVGMHTIEPGTYQFSLPSTSFTLSVLNVKTGEVEMFNVRPEHQPAIEQKGTLVFRNYEDGSVLNEVHFPGTGVFSEVIDRRDPGKTEAKRSSPDGSITIAER